MMNDQCFEGWHIPGDTVEDDRDDGCGDDRCGVECGECGLITWRCEE